MEAIIDFIFGAAENPLEMAFYFMCFLAILDALFSTINTFIVGVIKI